MCMDYQALNKLTVKDKFSLPQAKDLFNQLKGTIMFIYKYVYTYVYKHIS